MILDKIEINYPRIILQYKVKFSETRKPTYIEFIILKLIMDYSDKEQSIYKIIHDELKINNFSLFERAMRDLISFDIITPTNALFDKNILLNIKISELKISDDLRQSFYEKDYLLKNIIKFIELKYVYDPLTNRTKIFKKIDWDKKIEDNKCIFNFFKKENITYKLNIKDIKNKTLELMSDESDLFGENCELIEVMLLNNTPLSEIEDDPEIYYNYENAAFNSLIDFDENDFKIECESSAILNFFKKDKRKEQEFITHIFDVYNKKVFEVIKGKEIVQNEEGLENAFLLQDFPASNSFDFLFFNFIDMNSRSKFIERPKYISNSKIIFEYNINGDEVIIGYERKKILIATHKLNNLNLWKKATMVYANFKNNIEAYNVEKIYVTSIRENIYIARLLPDFKNNISNDLKETVEKIKDVFNTSLKFGDYDKVALCIGILFKLDENVIVEKIIDERLTSDLNYAREYSAIIKSLLKYNLINEKILIENIMVTIIIENRNKLDSKSFVKIMEKYNIADENNIIRLLENCGIEFSLEELIEISKIISKQNVDCWKININNSLIKYLNNVITNNVTDFYTNDSNLLMAQLDFASKFRSFNNALKRTNSIEKLIKLFDDVHRAELYLIQNVTEEMINKTDYLDFIGKLFNKPLKLFNKLILNHEYKNNKLCNLKIKAWEFIEKINDEIIKLIQPNMISESIEINRAIFRETNKELSTDEMIVDDFKLREYLEIFYLYDDNISDEIVKNKIIEIEKF